MSNDNGSRVGAAARLRAHPGVLVVLLLLLGLLIVSARVLVDGRASLSRAQAAQAAGQPEQAVAAYLDAARAYLPGSPYSDRAFDGLLALADGAAAAGRLADERAALEAFRAAALGTRSFFTPRDADLARVDQRLAIVLATLQARGPRVTAAVRAGATATAEMERLTALHGQRLASRPGPATGKAVAALLGLFLWIGAVVLFLLRGLTPTLRVDRGAATVAGVAFLVGFVLFAVGLSA